MSEKRKIEHALLNVPHIKRGTAAVGDRASYNSPLRYRKGLHKWCECSGTNRPCVPEMLALWLVRNLNDPDRFFLHACVHILLLF